MAGQKKKPRYSEGWIGIGNCGQKTSTNYSCG